jgi:predicted metallo-beta-lactamase superfamily hydrolase
VYTAAAFRGPKMYFLANRVEGSTLQEIVRRMKSIQRHQQSKLKLAHFGIDPRTNAAVIPSVQMNPSMGLEVHLSVQGKTLACALNLKRKMTVGCCERGRRGGKSTPMTREWLC